MKVDRRRFLGFTAGAAAGAASGVSLSRTVSDVVAAAEEPIYPPRGPEDFTLSVCRMCPGGCGLRVRRIGGRPVKVDGNPLHPVNGGRLCPKGQAALQLLYHPDRLAGPLRRVGPRGSKDSFEHASWDEAFAALGERLALLRQVGRPESLAMLRGPSRGIGYRMASRFLRAFGSPNDIVLDRGEASAALALFFGQGVRSAPAFDLAATDYVLSFGSALLEGWSSPVHTMRAYGEFRQGRPGRRGKLVQIDTRLSITGSMADEWIEVRPGTEGVFALGVAQVLVAEGLFDRRFVNDRCLGLEGFRDENGTEHEGLAAWLAREFGLGRVAAETGVASDVILRLAREFAAARRRLAVGPRRGPLVPGPLFDHLAVGVLNALMGSIDAPGGVLLHEPMPLHTALELPADPVAEAGRARPRLDGAGSAARPLLDSDPEELARALLERAAYPLEVLWVLDADPIFASATPSRFAQAFERIPLIVSFASIQDDTALHADWILPQSHFLETWDLDTSPPGVPFPSVSLAQPALEAPLSDSRPLAEILGALARDLGGPLAEAFPWEDSEALLRTETEVLYGARRGTVMGTEFDEAWVRMMERAGWWAPGYRSASELWERMRETGGWWDPFYDHGDWRRVLRTPSGRYEFRIDLLERLWREKAAARRPAAASESDDEPLLALVLFEPLPTSGGVGAELPFLQEILDPGHEERWETWAEIHPETAERLGVGDRQRVRITSQSGSIEARARLTRRVVPEAVAVPVGLGKQGGGRWAAGRGSNPLAILDEAREPVSRLPDLGSTRVRVRPAGGERGRSAHRG